MCHLQYDPHSGVFHLKFPRVCRVQASQTLFDEPVFALASKGCMKGDHLGSGLSWTSSKPEMKGSIAVLRSLTLQTRAKDSLPGHCRLRWLAGWLGLRGIVRESKMSCRREIVASQCKRGQGGFNGRNRSYT